ncbi:MAG TPA: Hsp70 family protein, partial [Oligoflexia bacterium]|nr:Hsp70 family protein [Oligoflexia bacterium]
MSSSFKELPVISAGPMTHRPSSQDPIIGIDLGTTNSLVAIVKNNTPIVLPSREGRNLIPSIVHYGADNNIEVGFSAKKRRSTDPKNTIYSAKRLLGRGAADMLDSGIEFPYDLDLSSPQNVQIVIGEKKITAIEVSAEILRE